MIDNISKTYKKIKQLRLKLDTVPKAKKGPQVPRARWNLGRTRVELSQLDPIAGFFQHRKAAADGPHEVAPSKRSGRSSVNSTKLEAKADRAARTRRKTFRKISAS